MKGLKSIWSCENPHRLNCPLLGAGVTATKSGSALFSLNSVSDRYAHFNVASVAFGCGCEQLQSSVLFLSPSLLSRWLNE